MTLAKCLKGLNLADALGQTYFIPEDEAHINLANRVIPPPVWEYTDDTAMAWVLATHLQKNGAVVQNELAIELATEYINDPMRAYGGTIQSVFREIIEGNPWQSVSKSVFGGQGSMGNGAAVRAVVLGCYFSEKHPEKLGYCAEQAVLSAEVTHAHLEAQVGAIATAIAAAVAENGVSDGLSMLDIALNYTPESEVKDKLKVARKLPFDTSIRFATQLLGNGTMLMAQDTVPFSLWCVARNWGDYEAGVWDAISGLGDRELL